MIYTNNQDKITIKEIILNYLNSISKLNLNIIQTGGEEKINFIQSFKRSVNGLHDLLIGEFDDEMDKASKKYFEEENKIEEKTTKDFIISNEKEYNYFTMKNCRKLFQELNLLLKRTNYLTRKSYEDLDDDEED